MNTSKKAAELGLYVSDCCEQELIFDKGDAFCLCPRCHSNPLWNLQEPLIRAEDLPDWQFVDEHESELVIA